MNKRFSSSCLTDLFEFFFLPTDEKKKKKKKKSGFIRGRRELHDGRGMLGERAETGTGEMVSQELSLGHSKFTFSQADRQAMGGAQVQDISEILNMR